MIQEEGYGLDRYSQEAAQRIREMTGDPEGDVHFMPGGTQVNLVTIDASLRPHEACVAANTGHIAVHETGAIEATGHKVISVDTGDGKLSPDLIEPVLKEHHFEHMVKPRLVYISNPTELGTVYSLRELQNLHEYCQSQNLLLYADGARLGAALTVKDSDVTLKDMYSLTDAFSIGGTKNGALLGEALVIRNREIKKEFRYLIKQKGALLAKGRILGIQFSEFFGDNLYFDLARHANTLAQRLAGELRNLGCSFWIDSPTNQIFPVMPEGVVERLSEQFRFHTWVKVDEQHTAIRLVTSWATKEEDIQNFIRSYRTAAGC